MSFRRALIGLLGIAVLMVGSPGWHSPASADNNLGEVTWPALTTFNPASTSYEVDVDGDPSATYYVVGYNNEGDFGAAQVVTPGHNVIHFEGDGPGGVLSLRFYRCPDDSLRYCTYVGSSPLLTVWRGVRVTSSFNRLGPSAPVPLRIVGPADVAAVDVEWSILDHGATRATGAASDVVSGGTTPPIGSQPQLLNGRRYELQMRVSATSETYGSLVAVTDPRSFVWDTRHRPAIEVLATEERGYARPSRVIYPIPDDYGDWMTILVVADDVLNANIQIRNADGEVVYDRPAGAMYSHKRRLGVRWNGLDSAKRPLPEGRYSLTITSYDEARNRFETTQHIFVSGRQPVLTVWRHRVTPDESVVGAPEQHCGAVVRPGRVSWPDSYGYRAQPDPDFGGVCYAETYHEISVPRSAGWGYGNARLTVLGAAAKDAPESHLIYDLRPPMWTTVIDGATFDPYRGRHVSEWEPAQVVGTREEPLLRWRVGTKDGNGYDVKTFVVEVEYYALLYPV